MNQIVIVDCDVAHAAELRDVLEVRGYGVSVFSAPQSAVRAMEAGDVALVVFVPHSPARWKSEIAAFWEAIRATGQNPPVLCVLPWHCNGPDDRLYGDKLQVSVIYEQ